MVERKVCLSSNDVAVGSKADKPSRAKIHLCPLWSKSRQTRVRPDCPLCAISDIRPATSDNCDAAYADGNLPPHYELGALIE